MSLVTIPLGELMLERGGSVDPSKCLDELFELYSIPAFDKRQPELKLGIDIGSSKQLVENGDVLLSKIVPHIRRAWVVGAGTGSRTIASGEWIVFRSNLVVGNYLRHFLVSDTFHNKFMRTVSGVGGSLLRARPSFVADIHVPLPCLKEQERIASILDGIDFVRERRRFAIKVLEDLANSIFYNMFGDPIRNSMGWDVCFCSDVCDRITVGIVVQPSSYYQEAGVPALRSLNIKPNSIKLTDLVYFSALDNERLNKTRVWAGDVVLVRTGQPGTAAVVPPSLDGVNAIDILITTPSKEKINPRYLSFFFNSSAGRSLVLGQARGQIQQHLNVGSLKSAEIPIPPLALQNEFSARWDKLESIKEKHHQHLKELDLLYSLVQHRAFRGEL